MHEVGETLETAMDQYGQMIQHFPGENFNKAADWMTS
jgi:hypothetical protein